MEVIQQLNEGEVKISTLVFKCKNIFRTNLFWQKTFLAIDNISDHHRSIQQAKMFLEGPYHMDSLVVVTARSQSVLEFLGISGDACFEMPDLGERDAVNLFLHHAASGKQFFDDEEKCNILTCVRRCYFSKGNGEDRHYHPLALQALGLQLGCQGENPCDWVKNLPRVRTFNYLSGGNPVFDILRSSFDMLSPRDKTLFMDVGCFSIWYLFCKDSVIQWLCDAFQQDEEEIICRLEHLKRKGLLQDVNLQSGRISVHDLYLEFAKLEANVSCNESTTLKKQMWMYVENGDLTELESKPKGGCWHKLIGLAIIQSSLAPKKSGRIVGGVGRIEGMKWDYFSNVEVLQLSGLHWGREVLNLEGLMRLKILELHQVREIDRVEGLEKLNHLTYFNWSSYSTNSSDGISAYIMGQLPSSLRRLHISEMNVVLGSDLLGHCHNLCDLRLYNVEARTLDLSNCGSLDRVELGLVWDLQTVLGLDVSRPSNLKSLFITCEDLVDISGIEYLIGLKRLHIDAAPKFEAPNLLALTELQDLSFSIEQDGLVVHAKDHIPHQLQELRWRMSEPKEGPNLSGFNHLEVLNLSWSKKLTSLVELGDLLALRHLDLEYCEHLLRLPSLDMSRSLKEIKLNGCSALELCEKDIQVLSDLPLLQPVPFSKLKEYERFRLDFVREKVLVHSSSNNAPSSWELWKDDDWEERDLGAPPIKIGKRGTWE